VWLCQTDRVAAVAMRRTQNCRASSIANALNCSVLDELFASTCSDRDFNSTQLTGHQRDALQHP